MSRHLRPIDWSNVDDELLTLLWQTEGNIMQRGVCWNDLSADAQERFSAAAKIEIEANRQREFDDALIEAAS